MYVHAYNVHVWADREVIAVVSKLADPVAPKKGLAVIRDKARWHVHVNHAEMLKCPVFA